MQIKPLSKNIHDKAIALGVTEISLHFSGGNDEGYLNVSMMPKYDQNLASDVEGWAWDTYSYSGAGEGNDYGDDIIYDLVNKKATASEWYTSRTEGDSEQIDLEIEG